MDKLRTAHLKKTAGVFLATLALTSSAFAGIASADVSPTLEISGPSSAAVGSTVTLDVQTVPATPGLNLLVASPSLCVGRTDCPTAVTDDSGLAVFTFTANTAFLPAPTINDYSVQAVDQNAGVNGNQFFLPIMADQMPTLSLTSDGTTPVIGTPLTITATTSPAQVGVPVTLYPDTPEMAGVAPQTVTTDANGVATFSVTPTTTDGNIFLATASFEGSLYGNTIRLPNSLFDADCVAPNTNNAYDQWTCLNNGAPVPSDVAAELTGTYSPSSVTGVTVWPRGFPDHGPTTYSQSSFPYTAYSSSAANFGWCLTAPVEATSLDGSSSNLSVSYTLSTGGTVVDSSTVPGIWSGFGFTKGVPCGSGIASFFNSGSSDPNSTYTLQACTDYSLSVAVTVTNNDGTSQTYTGSSDYTTTSGIPASDPNTTATVDPGCAQTTTAALPVTLDGTGTSSSSVSANVDTPHVIGLASTLGSLNQAGTTQASPVSAHASKKPTKVVVRSLKTHYRMRTAKVASTTFKMDVWSTSSGGHLLGTCSAKGIAGCTIQGLKAGHVYWLDAKKVVKGGRPVLPLIPVKIP